MFPAESFNERESGGAEKNQKERGLRASIDLALVCKAIGCGSQCFEVERAKEKSEGKFL